MNLTDLYNEYFEDEYEKVASQDIDYEENEETESEEDFEKLASHYVNVGRSLARKDFEAIEKLAAENIEADGEKEGKDKAESKKIEILERMKKDPEYKEKLMAKHTVKEEE